jgi:hypothetical protein
MAAPQPTVRPRSMRPLWLARQGLSRSLWRLPLRRLLRIAMGLDASRVSRDSAFSTVGRLRLSPGQPPVCPLQPFFKLGGGGLCYPP